MNQKLLYILLFSEFSVLLALVLLTAEFPSLFSSFLAFPFEQIGMGLRALSLTGRLGNGLALAIWVGLSASPLISVMKHKGNKSCNNESIALALLSVSLLFVLMGMANPVMIVSVFPDIGGGGLPAMKSIMGSAVWSIAVLWGVLRLLRLFRAGDTNKLLGYLRALLYTLCALFTGIIAISCGSVLAGGLADIQRSMDGVMTIVRFLVAALPYALDIVITLSALTLLDALLSDDASGAVNCTNKLSRLCCLSLGITTVSMAVLNILQLVLSPWLSDIAGTVKIPIMSLAFVLAVLLVARLIAENRQLKEDNDLFI